MSVIWRPMTVYEYYDDILFGFILGYGFICLTMEFSRSTAGTSEPLTVYSATTRITIRIVKNHHDDDALSIRSSHRWADSADCPTPDVLASDTYAMSRKRISIVSALIAEIPQKLSTVSGSNLSGR
jgi:hypothetical protein